MSRALVCHAAAPPALICPHRLVSVAAYRLLCQFSETELSTPSQSFERAMRQKTALGAAHFPAG
jgi:hypothetical protein